MAICCVARKKKKKNGIPRIRGTGSPVLTLAWNIFDFRMLFPDDNSIFTYSLQDNGDSESNERLYSSSGREYQCNPSSLVRAELITTEGQPMSSIAGTGNRNLEILGLKASNVAMRWGTVKGWSTYKSVLSLHASILEWIAAAAERHDDKLPI